MLISFSLFACGELSQTSSTANTDVVAAEDVTGTSDQTSSDDSMDVVVVDAGEVDFDPSTIKTMGDFRKYKNDEFYNYQDGYNDKEFQMAIEINNVYYRATADLPKDVVDKLNGEDFGGTLSRAISV